MQEFEPKRKNKILTKEFIGKYAYVLVLAVLLIGGISYGYTFFIQNKKITSGSITTAALTINFTDRTINATGLSVPSTNQEGLTEFTKSLTITNQTAVDGRIKLTLTRTSGLDLTDMSYALVVNGAIQEIADIPSDGVILSTAIMGSEVINVELRLWPKTTYSGSTTTFVGTLTPEIKYLGNKATTSISSPAGKYVNFNCSGNSCEVWQIVKVEDDRLVLTRQADYSGATSRTNSNKYNSSLTFNDNSMITSVSTDGKNVYLAKTVKVNGGSGTLADPYTLINNDWREPDKKVIAVITYKENTTTVGTQNMYYNQTNYISQVVDNEDFKGWTDGTNDYELGDTITFTSDTNLTAKIVPKLRTQIMAKCNDSSVTYVEKYNTANGAAIDTPDGSGNEDVCYYTSSDSNNLAGQNGNVIFGDYCWQIVRTTANGGVKLLYNGPKTNDDKCPNNNSSRPTSLGVTSAADNIKIAIIGNNIYGETFEIFDDNGTNKFRLKNTFTANWNGDYDNDGELDYYRIIGKYICGDSSNITGNTSTCEYIYYIGRYESSTNASVKRYNIVNNSHYSQIATSSFNSTHDSLSLVSYMFNDTHVIQEKEVSSSYEIIIRSNVWGAFYYGDSVTWNNNHYELKMSGVTPTSRTAWTDIRDNVQGMYTCKSTTDTSCSTVYYIVTNSSDSYMYSLPLSNNENINKTISWTIGTGYTENNGVYSLTGTSTLTIPLKDWYTNYINPNYANYYTCDDFTSTTCPNDLYYVGSTSNQVILYNIKSENYVYANDVSYVNGEYKLVLNDPTNKPYKSVWKWSSEYNTLNSTHYTCFEDYNDVTNSCGGTIYYIFHVDDTSAFYLELTDGDKIEDAIDTMLNTSNSSSSDINKYNSPAKSLIESWYESNLSSLSNNIDDDAVFCGDRRVKALNGWSPNGNLITNYFYFMNSTSYSIISFFNLLGSIIFYFIYHLYRCFFI